MKPPDLAEWTGDGWKGKVRARFYEQVEGPNTPNCENVRGLFRRYLDIDITKQWTWKGTSSEVACRRLDELIKLRGNLTHRGKGYTEVSQRAIVHREDVDGAVDLVDHLAQCTDKALRGGH